MSTGPLLQSVGALPADQSPSAVHQPAAQALCGVGSVLCEAALWGGGPSYVRPHTRTDQSQFGYRAPDPTRPILHRTSGQVAIAGLCTQASKGRTMRHGGCGDHQHQVKGPAVARVRRLDCDGALTIDPCEELGELGGVAQGSRYTAIL